MNEPSTSDQTNRRFAEAVQSYAPIVPRKWQRLLTLNPGIAELRRKGASYQAITETLRAADVARLAHDCPAVLPGYAAPVPTTEAAPSPFRNSPY
jgi:hypothetical protein